MLVPHVPGAVLAAQAAMIEAAGLGGIAAPEFYGNPLVTLSHCAANTNRVDLLSAITLAGQGTEGRRPRCQDRAGRHPQAEE